MSDYKHLDGESFRDYFLRIGSNHRSLGGWTKLAQVFNKMTGNDLSETMWRKWYKAETNDDYNFSPLPPMNFAADDICDEDPDKLELMRELERMKIMYRDSRNAWNKQNYKDARVSETFDILEEKLSDIANQEFPKVEKPTVNSDNDMLIMLTDWHIGQTFRSFWGEYNTDIARERVGKLLNSVIEIVDTNKCKNAHIVLGGDMISNSIHKTIQITNKENVINQIKIVTELISSFVYELCQNFENVYLYSVVGNHTRLDRKDDALHDERLDDLIPWIVERTLVNVKNFYYCIGNNLDVGIADVRIKGQSYIACHGDYDAFNDNAVYRMVSMLGFTPYAMLFGHMHTCALSEANGIKMIRGGSLAGSGDQYTVEKRLCGKPSQMVCICDKYGVKAYYPIEL